MEDTGIRIQLCIYQDTASDYTSGGHEYIDVVDYRFHVKRVDTGTQTTLTGGKMTMLATVYGTCISGCSNYRSGDTVQTSVTLPSSANTGYTYKMTVPWHAATIRIDSTGNTVQAARADVQFFFRGSSVTFHSDTLCVGQTNFGVC